MGHARARKVPAQLVEDEDYQLRYERVAGIDVAKAKADVCTRLPAAREGGRRASRVETVGATAREVLALAGRLLADGVEVVVMESTSDYWRIWYYLLESAGLNVQLVNSRHARQLAGRPKTDQKDAQWIARLAEMGLLRPSFVPPPEIRALRDLTRTRLQLLKDRTREWQRLEKLLEGALIKLSSVVYSMARNKTAWAILEAIVAGERDPEGPRGPHPRQHQGRQCRDRAGLEGMLLGDHHPVLIRLHMDHITLLDRLAAEIEDQIEAALDAIPAAWGVTADGVPSSGPGTGCRGAARGGAARGDPRRQPQARQGDHRRNRPGHDQVAHRVAGGHDGRSRSSAAGSAVELFPEDVGVPGVPRGFAGHVGHDPPQRVPVAVDGDSETRFGAAGGADRAVAVGDCRLVVG